MKQNYIHSNDSVDEDRQAKTMPDAYEIDSFLASDSPQFLAVVERFGIEADRVSPRQRNSAARRSNLTILVANLLASIHRRPSKPIKYFRSPKYYVGRSIYRADTLSAKVLGQLVDDLERAGLVQSRKGHKDFVGNQSVASLVWPTDAAKCVFRELGLQRKMIGQSPDRPLITLKSKKNRHGRAKLVEYDPTVIGKNERYTLGLYNALLSHTNVTLDLSAAPPHIATLSDSQSIDFSEKALYRVFNDVDAKAISLERGGRFYGGWWQNVQRDARPYITINGEPTIELDFEAFHPRMIYHKCGIGFFEDPYQIPALMALAEGFDQALLRKAVKFLLNMLINTTKRKLQMRLSQAPDELFSAWKISLPENISIERALEEVRNYHKRISNHFMAGAGLKLQFTDSKICERVLINGRSRNIPLLPIHDSFICRQRDAEWLKHEMNASYRSIMGDFDPRITIK